LAMSAHVFREEIDEYLQAGMNGYLAKPFKPTQLFDSLSRALIDQSPVISVLDDRTSASNLVNEGMLIQDIETIGFSAVENIVELFRVSSRDCVSDIEQASIERNYSRVAMLAHRLKSSAGSVGLDRLHSHADRLEKQCQKPDVQAIDLCNLDHLRAESENALASLLQRLANQ
jgi:two-component system, OmpR family, sensor histidine kinase TorS